MKTSWHWTRKFSTPNFCASSRTRGPRVVVPLGGVYPGTSSGQGLGLSEDDIDSKTVSAPEVVGNKNLHAGNSH